MALPVSKNTNYGLGVACIVFLVIAAWFGLPVLSDMQSYADWDKPAEIAKLREALVFGGVGFLLALGVNLVDILRPVLVLLPAPVLAIVPGLAQAVRGPSDPPVAPPPASQA